MTDRGKPIVRGATGGYYYPLAPKAEELEIADVALHLSNLCRYTGATRRHYSVAEHCVHMSRLVEPKDAYVALMHDWPEFAIGDLNRSVKGELPAFMDIEDRNWAIGVERFNLPAAIPPAVLKVDHEICDIEKAALLPGFDVPEHLTERGWNTGMIYGVDAPTARQMFLDRFYDLAPEDVLGQFSVCVDGRCC